MICHYFSEPQWLIISPDVPALLYYTHIPVALLALIIGTYIFSKMPKRPQNQYLFLLTLSFFGWITINLIAWTNIHAPVILSVWPLFGIFTALISVFSIYLTYTFINNDDVPNTLKATLLLLITPIFIFSHTDLSIEGFNISDCDAFGFEGLLFVTYYNLLGVLAIIWTAYFLIKAFVSNPKSSVQRKKIVLFGLGIQSFLITFISIIWIAGNLANAGIIEDSYFEFYGLFGMVAFLVLLGILITQYKAFNVRVVSAQTLLVALVILVGSQVTVAETRLVMLVGVATLVLIMISGLLLNRSIKSELKQREKIESLAKDLTKANERLRELDKQKSEFVSIASHQLRSPLTTIRGYASMLAEGSFGTMSAKATEAAGRIEEAAKLMAMSIEDYLNISRIEAGNMKYILSDFNFKEMVDTICDGLRAEAMKKGLVLLFRSDINSRAIVNADIGKVNQIIHNLINNSIKYTPQGSISVLVRDDIQKKKIFVDITDTGIGMSQETIAKLFHKFSRADNANSVNVSGTGLGLFVAAKMAEAMGGEITAQSAGDGMGSTFTLTLPLAM